MDIRLSIDASVISRAIERALAFPQSLRGDFFHDLRRGCAAELADLLSKNGLAAFPDLSLSSRNLLKDGIVVPLDPIRKLTGWKKDREQVLDLQFCAKYGHDDYSLSAINYLDRPFCELPALLPFRLVDDFSIGNIVILVGNEDCHIGVTCTGEVSLTGYSYSVSKRKRKSYVAFLGLRFSGSLVEQFIGSSGRCDCEDSLLDEIRIGQRHFPILYICRKCGRLYTCQCFSEHLGTSPSVLSDLRGDGDSLRNLSWPYEIGAISVKSEICHLCKGGVPRQIYGSEMYYSAFLRRYLPYHTLFSLRKHGKVFFEGSEHKEIENEAREYFGYAKIGEKWVTETTLFRIVKALFSHVQVLHHYRGSELQGLELDIWLPELSLGIEYQGEQHFEAIEHWGGDEGLKSRLQNDRRKKAICKRLGYDLVEFTYKETITFELVTDRLARYLQQENA
jgi:hypothetical protein